MMTYDHVSVSLPDGRSVVSVVTTTEDGTPTHRYRLVDSDGQVIKDFANLREIAEHIDPRDGDGARVGGASGQGPPWPGSGVPL